MREIRLYGSEGGGAHALPTPIKKAKFTTFGEGVGGNASASGRHHEFIFQRLLGSVRRIGKEGGA